MQEEFKEAVRTWRCATQVNFNVDDTNPYPGGNGTGLVQTGLLPLGTITVNAETAITEEPCWVNQSLTLTEHYEVLDFTITFNNRADWEVANFLQSTALHELGHAHLLLHTCNSEDFVMHPDGAFPISLSQDDKDGGLHESQLGALTWNFDCTVEDRMIPIDINECKTLPVIQVNGNEIQVDVFPNPSSRTLNINFNAESLGHLEQLFISNSQGAILAMLQGISNKNSIDISKLPSGVFFLNLVSDSGKHFQIGSFIKQ